MKRFLKEMCLFVIIGVISVMVIILSHRIMVNKYGKFSVSSESESLVLGNSHPACAFNDGLVEGFVNVADSAESYFYTYYKLKKLLENNKQIKNVFIEFDYIGFNERSDEWLFQDNKYWKYCPVIDFEGARLLIKGNYNNIGQIFVGIARTVINREYGMNNWGGYSHSMISSLQCDIEKTEMNIKILEREYLSKNNLKYLQKIVEICDEHDVSIYFIRVPFHKSVNIHDKTLDWMKNEYFQDIEFIDFVSLQLESDEYMDTEHLNDKGAEVFSVFFNQLIEEGLLDSRDKQEFVNKKLPK